MANGLGPLIARQQHHPAPVLAHLRHPLERRAHRHELLAQSVDGAGAVSDQVRAMAGEHAQLGYHSIVRMQNWQIGLTHPRLIGDDPGVFGVGFGLPPR
ncbi:hypothetical protein MMUR_28730 [Mycolicibacterium murale]|uniref:Uncharacterized protein n=1 Tax=Mycolicibacterium murale TaxID=182220 RepID=A0A7I9WNE3_9MYCO|nr:hypothetical protein MMUR_28730 [Mycolicibacterium murale]